MGSNEAEDDEFWYGFMYKIVIRNETCGAADVSTENSTNAIDSYA